jgi:hypothetical protein
MKRFLRWTLIFVLLLLAAVVSVPLFVRHRVYALPEWYPKAHQSKAAQAAAANRADQKLIQARSEIVGAYAAQTRAARAGTQPTSLPAAQLGIKLSEDEINSWIPKWEDELGWSGGADQHFSDPTIVFNEDEIILAATVKDWKTIVSLHFVPRLQNGKLLLTLRSVMAGTLPLPRVAWSSYQDRLVESVQARLPEFRREAAIDANGRANTAAVSAAMTELLLHMVNDEPAEPVLFLPDQIGHSPRSLPVVITDIKLADKVLTIVVEPMDAARRGALLKHLRGNGASGAGADLAVN